MKSSETIKNVIFPTRYHYWTCTIKNLALEYIIIYPSFLLVEQSVNYEVNEIKVTNITKNQLKYTRILCHLREKGKIERPHWYRNVTVIFCCIQET